MKSTNLFENENRLDIMKAMQAKKFASLRDSLDRKDISILVRILSLKNRKQDPLKGVSEDSIESLQAVGLLDNKGTPTAMARSFIAWVKDNPNREQQWADKRGDADDALTRGQLKRDNDWVNPMQKRARKIVRNLDDDGKEIFRKWYNRFVSDKTRNLSKSWGDAPNSEVNFLQNLGMLDVNGDLTEFGEFALNYYTAFKNDPDGLDRVPSARRVGNFGKTSGARRRRMGRVVR